MSKNIVIIGAGPSGLMSADCLLRKGYNVTVLEKEDSVGGLGRSFYWEGFIVDYGPHAFHVKDGKYNTFFSELFKDNPEDIFFEDRSELLLMKRKLFHYPLKSYELLFKFNPFFVLKLIFDFLITSIIYRFIAVPDDNFESWCIKRFGKSLYKLTFGYYTEKVWGVRAAKISPKFAVKKIHGLNLKDIIHKLLGGRGEEQETYWKKLIYPKYGSGQLFGKLAERVEKNGGIIIKNCTILEIDHQNRDSISISYEDDQGKIQNLPYDYVISTIPLTNLLGLLRPKANDYVEYTSKLLKSRALVLINVIFDEPKILNCHYIYLVDRKFLFNRIMEQKNMSPYTAPKDKTLLTLEKTCSYNDSFWRLPDEELFQKALEDMGKLSSINVGKIEKFGIIRISDAYSIYNLDFDKHLMIILDYLSSIKNLFSAGRQGLFLQSDMYESMEMGRIVVEDFILKGLNSKEWYDFVIADQESEEF